MDRRRVFDEELKWAIGGAKVKMSLLNISPLWSFARV